MTEMGYELDLAPEPLGAECEADIVANNLHGYFAILLHIAGKINRCHRTLTELANDLVTGSDGRPETV